VGGDSLFVDGFYCATKLKETYPDEFRFLTQVPVKSFYYEKDKYQFVHTDHVIRLDPFDESLKQIRYNSVNLECL
jgi:trimethyllysine dioxygenase